MPRPFISAVKTLLDALNLPMLRVCLTFRDLGITITNSPKDIVLDGVTYSGAQATANDWSFTLHGLSENLKFETPTATLRIDGLDGLQQSRFLLDQFRGDRVTVRIVYVDSNWDWQDLGWVTTFDVDVDQADGTGVTLRLSSSDVATGEEVPRRTTGEYGCQHILSQGYCIFRWGSHRPVALKLCDHGYDSDNGCKAHFPDVVDPLTGTTIPQAKPYGGFLGGLDQQLVLGG